MEDLEAYTCGGATLCSLGVAFFQIWVQRGGTLTLERVECK